MFYPILTTPAQFKWLADQLRACRLIIAASEKIALSLFGNKLENLKHATGDIRLCSPINSGMMGYPLRALVEPVWQTQFKYRAPSTKGMRQYPNGDLYIPPMKEHSRVKCDGLPLTGQYPISSLLFRLDMADRAHPRWLVEPHQNVLPRHPKQESKNA